MTTASITIRTRGVDKSVPAVQAGPYAIVRTGRFPRVAQLFDEELVEDANFPTVAEALQVIRHARLSADLFTFARPFAKEPLQMPYPQVCENLAVVSTASYEDWWKALPQESRKNTRLAAKRGVTVGAAAFDDVLVAGIKAIYDETPVRQGRRFWHYHKPIERVRMLNATYPDRSHFVGAWCGDELIGFIKYVVVDRAAILIQILAKESHRDKKTLNALLNHTMQSCHESGLECLVYGKFSYGVNQDSSLTEFKRRNGFREMTFPRYYVPLNVLGRLAFSAGLHEGWQNFIPQNVRGLLVRARAKGMQLISGPAARG
jgi:hypothetical protein